MYYCLTILALFRNKQKYKYAHHMQSMFIDMRLMSKSDNLIMLKGTKVAGLGKISVNDLTHA